VEQQGSHDLSQETIAEAWVRHGDQAWRHDAQAAVHQVFSQGTPCVPCVAVKRFAQFTGHWGFLLGE
jgi:hypothetical protein